MSTHDRVPATDRRPGMSDPAAPVVSLARPAKIQDWHLERLAIVYVRQSSEYQVINNKESAEVQANFRNSRSSWGWSSIAGLVIDEDQAHSGDLGREPTGLSNGS